MFKFLATILTAVFLVITSSQVMTGQAAGVNAGKAYIIDGDTLAFGKARVRIFGIDAPEMEQHQGQISKAFLMNMIQGKEIMVYQVDTDKYGRIVARVETLNGIDIGEEMVANGYAIAYRYFSQNYVPAERAARAAGIGLWSLGGVEDGGAFRRAQ